MLLLLIPIAWSVGQMWNGKGECSASLDNINVLIYVLAPQLWGYLYNKDHKLPLYVGAFGDGVVANPVLPGA